MLPHHHVLGGRYRIDMLIGSSHSSALYRAFDLELDEPCAVRVLTLAGAEARQQFLQEARHLTALAHPHLVKISDYSIDENVAYQFLVMPYVPGETLEQMLQARELPFTCEEVLRWADQLLDVISYLRAACPAPIRCEIMPKHLKLTAQGDMMLLDLEPAGQQLPVPEGANCPFASPEQLAGQWCGVRSDLYTLSATLYTLLTQVPPDAVRKRLQSIDDGFLDSLLSAQLVGEGVPRAVDRVLEQALNLKPDRRFESAAAMQLALHRAAELACLGQEAVNRPSGKPMVRRRGQGARRALSQLMHRRTSWRATLRRFAGDGPPMHWSSLSVSIPSLLTIPLSLVLKRSL